MKKTNPLPNMVMSPYSLGYMMAMVANVASGPTKMEVSVNKYKKIVRFLFKKMSFCSNIELKSS